MITWRISLVNQLVGAQGHLTLFVNNIPYDLSSYLTVETDGGIDDILALSHQKNVEPIYDKGPDELFGMVTTRQFNVTSIGKNEEWADLEKRLSGLYYFSTRQALEAQGYVVSPKEKKKLFVSYCHKDKQQVHDLVDQLRSYGLNFWLDEEQIDVGESIMQKINDGMVQSDSPVVFLSHHTRLANYASFELETFFQMIIAQGRQDKPWFIVKLDDVDPDDIFRGLGNYKYFDMLDSTVIELAKALKQKISD